MQPEVISALIAAGGALAGVTIGIVGPLIAARIQARGASEQASATLVAAEHAAKSQYRAVMDDQARQARRNVYSGFLDAVRELEQDIRERRPDQESVHTQRALGAARAQVEIEGPDEVEAAARTVHRQLAAWQFARRQADDAAAAVEALNCPDPAWSDGQRAVAEEIRAALASAEAAFVTVQAQGGFYGWREWRCLTARSPDEGRRAGHQLMRQWRNMTLPAADVTAEFDRAVIRVRDAVMASHHARLPFRLSLDEVLRGVALRGKVDPDGGAGISGWRPLEEALQAFRLAARQALHEIPEL
ncbi:hypothetical protein [Streptomyces gardneri]|uniref:hypothetical protein n=1 Tax=Streptomyces gardneri TaxID=66892 RepID=UPI003694CB07